MRRNGFTLLEVMVALAIAIPSLLLIYRQGGLALALTSSSLANQEAIARAQSHLSALDTTALAPGDREGEDGGGYRWRTRIVPIVTAVTQGEAPRRSAYAAGATLYAVSVQIAWRAARGPQTFTLETRRIGPAAAEPP